VASTSHALSALAAAAGGEIRGNGDVPIDRVAAVDEADDRALTFAVDERWVEKALKSRAAAVIVSRETAIADGGGKSFILVDNVREALAAVLRSFERPRPRGPFTHRTAIVDPDARVGHNVWIDAGAFIGPGARLDDDVVLSAGSFVGRDAVIGARTIVHPRALILDYCVIGADCVLQAGCVIGGDGFGFARVGSEQIKIPQLGNVVLGDRVEIGACTTIDRAVTGTTSIGAGTKIDNLVQVAHNVQIGRNCTICAQTGIAGSTRIGDNVIMAGQVGIVGHIQIGDNCIIGASAKVIGSLSPNSHVSGFYAQDHRTDIEQKVLLRKLPKLFEQVRELMNARGPSRTEP